MPEVEGNGFVVKDRRLEAEDKKPEAAGTGQKKDDCAEATAKAEQVGIMPEINFGTFIFSLSSSALYHLGELPDPETNQPTQDLPLAKQTIDILGMLKEKTKGNLEDEEERMLEGMLYDLRMRYVAAIKAKCGG